MTFIRGEGEEEFGEVDLVETASEIRQTESEDDR